MFRIVCFILVSAIWAAGPSAAQVAPKAPEGGVCGAMPMTVRYGDLINCTASNSAPQNYTFAGTSGDLVQFRASWTAQSGCCLSKLELFDPSGGKLAEAVGDSDLWITNKLAASGVFTARVSAGNVSVPYRLDVERITPPSGATSLALGQVVADEINPTGDLDLFTFPGSSGSRVTITVERRSGNAWPQFELYDSTGLRVATTYGSSGTATVTVTLLDNGTHTVVVSSRFYSEVLPYTVKVECAGTCFTASLTPTSASVPAAGGSGTVNVTATPPTVQWTAFSNTNWIQITAGASGQGAATVSYLAAPNPSASSRQGRLTIAGQPFDVLQLGSSPKVPLMFVPIQPCRVADTRSGQGTTGQFGPPSLRAGETRSFPIPLGRCLEVPPSAQAYSFNVTVVPGGPLSYLTIWPAGNPQPLVSTLNSFEGRIVANAAIVPAGANGAVSVYVSDATDVIIDINGYFIQP